MAKKVKRAAAFIVCMDLPDDIPENQEPSFIIPQFSNSFAVQPMCKIMTTVVAPGETAQSLLAKLTGEAKHGLINRPAIVLDH